jgi:hypothetical protein
MGAAAAPPGIGGAAFRYRAAGLGSEPGPRGLGCGSARPASAAGSGRSSGLAASAAVPPARPRLRGRVRARGLAASAAGSG